MHIHIIEAGAPPAMLEPQFGDYAMMFQRLLQSGDGRFSFSASAVFKGDAAPPPAAFDGLLVTGSPAAVYEGHDWIAPIESLIRDTAKAGKPQAGVCFGHQLMAKAFGGRVEKSTKGWGVGLHEYTVKRNAPWMEPAPARFACSANHQDQVTQPPAGSRVLAGSEFCPYGMLDYRQGPAMSIQLHPEFPVEFSLALLRGMSEKLQKEQWKDAIASLKGSSDRVMIGAWIAKFFLQTGQAS